jgi:hypothetical protein
MIPVKASRLSDRIYSHRLNPTEINRPINYTEANKKLDILKQKSIDYLKQVLDLK